MLRKQEEPQHGEVWRTLDGRRIVITTKLHGAYRAIVKGTGKIVVVYPGQLRSREDDH